MTSSLLRLKAIILADIPLM
jgi:hypothetical protein